MQADIMTHIDRNMSSNNYDVRKSRSQTGGLHSDLGTGVRVLHKSNVNVESF